MTTVSVIIRCFNEAEHIGKLLAGIGQQTLPAHEVIVVDSGSTDGTVEIARRFGAKILTISPQEFTFGRSLNLGCAEATGDLLLIASAHVYPIFDTWIEEMAAPFADETVALSYGRQVGDHRTRFSEHQVFAKWFPTESVEHQAHPFCNNANAAIRRALWQELPYDEALTGLEDMDWARKIMARGHNLSYVASAAVAHVHQEKFAQIRNRYRREAIAHRQIFPEQRMTWGEALRFGLANIASDYWHALWQGSLPKAFWDIPRFRTAQFLGTLRGFQQRGPVAATLLRHFYYPQGFGGRTQANPDRSAVGQAINYEEVNESNAA